MSPSVSPSSQAKVPAKIQELDDLLGQREVYLRRIIAAQARKRDRDERSAKRYVEEVGDAPAMLDEINLKIGKLMSRHHAWITRLFSKTIARETGTVSVVIRPPEVDTPKDESRATARLFRLFGKRYVKVKLSLNRRAIAQAPRSHLENMRPVGVGVVNHLAVLVKSPSEDKATTILKRPYEKPKG